jgi:predicted metal-dependent phosphoesterase TrpH
MIRGLISWQSNFLRIDLHSHSTYSDGVLTPAELIRRAASNHVSVLALTDHDEVGGLGEAADAAREARLVLVPGVEISATWAGYTVHVLGLAINPRNPRLADGLAGQKAMRWARATLIAERLSLVGITDTLSGAVRHAGESVPGRAHFARYLAEQGVARNMQTAFSRYLAAGRPGFVAQNWAPLEQAIAWIHAAGGCAVLAHPDRYPFSALQLNACLERFKESGGDAIEYGGGSRSGQASVLRSARSFGFALSAGSDFHAPASGAGDLGGAAQIPCDMRTVWQDWDIPAMAA